MTDLDLSTNVVILNGPPNSGKDTIAAAMVEADPEWRRVRRFKEELYRVAAMLYCVPYEDVVEICNDRELKDAYHDAFGCTPREALIYVSESVVKPHFGDEWFGRKAALSLESGCTHFFSDGGFMAEMNPLLAAVGENNFLLVTLVRPGCDFSNDSRDYLDPSKFRRSCTLINDGDIEDTLQELAAEVCEMLAASFTY